MVWQAALFLLLFLLCWPRQACHPKSSGPELIQNVLVLTAAIMGSLKAFLRHNIFPAVIFMGDAGAYFLGFMTAALSIAGAAKGSILFPLIVPLIACGLPVFDVFTTILRRRSAGAYFSG